MLAQVPFCHRVKLLPAYLWALATLRSSPFGVNAMLRPSPKLYLYSCGWSEALDHLETVSGGLVFDISNVGTDYENREQRGSRREAPCWEVFGGEGSDLDHELARTKEFKDLLRLLKSLCAHFFDWLQSASSVPVLIVSVISNYGKHRSRWLLTQLEQWLAGTYSDSKSVIHVEHLSESNRRQELNHYYNLVRGGIRRTEARTSAKFMGIRRNRRRFEDIKCTLKQEVNRLGHRNHWINVHRYPANAALLEECLDCIATIRTDRRREQDVPAKRKADSISDSAASASARSTSSYSDATTLYYNTNAGDP